MKQRLRRLIRLLRLDIRELAPVLIAIIIVLAISNIATYQFAMIACEAVTRYEFGDQTNPQYSVESRPVAPDPSFIPNSTSFNYSLPTHSPPTPSTLHNEPGTPGDATTVSGLAHYFHGERHGRE